MVGFESLTEEEAKEYLASLAKVAQENPNRRKQGYNSVTVHCLSNLSFYQQIVEEARLVNRHLSIKDKIKTKKLMEINSFNSIEEQLHDSIREAQDLKKSENFLSVVQSLKISAYDKNFIIAC